MLAESSQSEAGGGRTDGENLGLKPGRKVIEGPVVPVTGLDLAASELRVGSQAGLPESG